MLDSTLDNGWLIDTNRCDTIPQQGVASCCGHLFPCFLAIFVQPRSTVVVITIIALIVAEMQKKNQINSAVLVKRAMYTK